jgi:hypothetical protein
VPGFRYLILVDRDQLDSFQDFDEAVYALEAQLAARPEAHEGEVKVEEWWGGAHRLDLVCRLARVNGRLTVAYDGRQPGARSLPYGPRWARQRLSPLAANS